MPRYRPDSDTELNYPDEELDASTDNDDNSTSEEDAEITQSNVDDSRDADESPDSNMHLNDNNNGYDLSMNTSDTAEGKSKKKRAESAHDLVRSQENLIMMLQRMKNDLSKMDREATSIKEEVVRSRQLFDVVVAKRRIHQLDQSVNGYNLKYAMPKVTYSTYKRHTDSNWKASPHLCQLSSFHPSSPETSRRSSLSHTSRRGSHQNDIEYIRSKIRQDYRRKYQQNSQRELSDTDSDCSLKRASAKSRGFAGNESAVSGISVSGISTDSCDSDSSMTDSSADRISKRLTEYELKRKERRSSYFFEQKTESPQTDLSDGVCV